MTTPPHHRPRALGIDFGERRIGLALSDPEARYALPLTVVERSTDRRAVYRIAEIARREGVELLVLGEPRRPDGGPSDGHERVRRFGAKLTRATGLPVRWVEETLTTVAAEERLRRAGRRRVADGELDMVAAQILLQEALDGGGRRLSVAAEGDGSAP